MNWIMIKGFNTATGFKEWLEDKGVKTKKKKEEIVNRLLKGEIIEYGQDSRLRYEEKYEVGIFYIERKEGS